MLPAFYGTLVGRQTRVRVHVRVAVGRGRRDSRAFERKKLWPGTFTNKHYQVCSGAERMSRNRNAQWVENSRCTAYNVRTHFSRDRPCRLSFCDSVFERKKLWPGTFRNISIIKFVQVHRESLDVGTLNGWKIHDVLHITSAHILVGTDRPRRLSFFVRYLHLPLPLSSMKCDMPSVNPTRSAAKIVMTRATQLTTSAIRRRSFSLGAGRRSSSDIDCTRTYIGQRGGAFVRADIQEYLPQ